MSASVLPDLVDQIVNPRDRSPVPTPKHAKHEQAVLDMLHPAKRSTTLDIARALHVKVEDVNGVVYKLRNRGFVRVVGTTTERGHICLTVQLIETGE